MPGSTDTKPAAVLIGLALVASVLPARAQQLVLDQTYTATTANTTDSHYYAKPLAGWPANWSAPINYGKGTAYVRFDVLEKPSTKMTFYNICLEGNSGTCCLPLSPLYSTTGVVTFNAQFTSFWNYSTVDWSKGLHQIALILKDENQNKVQGNPDFYPTQIHVTITFVPQGGTYVPPPETDAGMSMQPVDKDAGMPTDRDGGVRADAAAAGSGIAGSESPVRDSGAPAAQLDAALSVAGAGSIPVGSAGIAAVPPSPTTTGASGAAASSGSLRADAGNAAGANAVDGSRPVRSGSGSRGGCAISRVRSGPPASALAVLLPGLLLWRRRARSRCRERQRRHQPSGFHGSSMC
jgi:hypothetical protein